MMVDSGRRYLDELQKSSENDPSLDAHIAFGHEQLGDLLGGRRTTSKGRTEEALASYQRAESGYRDLLERGHEETNMRGDLSRILQKQGEVLASTDVERADDFFKRSRSLAVMVHEARGGDKQSATRLCSNLLKTGDLLSDLGQSGKAMIYYDEARELIEPHLVAEPDDLSLQRNMALVERRVAWILEEREETEEARQLWESSLARIRSIVVRSPDDLRRKWDLAWSCYHLGALLARVDRQQEALPLLVESVERMTRACVGNPGASQYRNDLQLLATTVQEILFEIEEAEIARQVIRETLLVLQPTVESMPGNIALLEVYERIQSLREEGVPESRGEAGRESLP